MNYKAENGIVVSPGKFEGEPEWVITLWEMVMNGCADTTVHDGSMAIDGFKLDAEMSRLTGLDADSGLYVCLWSGDQGFVSHKIMSETQLFECEGFSIEEPTDEYNPRAFDKFEDHPEYESGY